MSCVSEPLPAAQGVASVKQDHSTTPSARIPLDENRVVT